MAAPTSLAQTTQTNRRKRVRHRIQTPAYATFTGESKGTMLELHEIVNISEGGVAIQCEAPLEVGRRINLCLDLAECPDHIYTTGHVIWSHGTGLAGLRFAELPPISLFRLREWLFLNAVSAVANADEAGIAMSLRSEQTPPRPSYTDRLTAVTAVQREVEALGANLPAALRLIVTRAQALIRASGAAIAMAERDPRFMVCRARAGEDAPPLGARLEVGSGFSGECVRSARLLRCDDSETDPRVDAASCRALGIRSIIAVPVRVGGKPVAILEAFSSEPDAFGECDDKVMQRLADTILAAVNRAVRAENLPAIQPTRSSTAFAPTPGSVLFASAPEPRKTIKVAAEMITSGSINLPRKHLILLIAALAAIATALGYHSAPLLESKLGTRERSLQTVLASSDESSLGSLAGGAIETATFEQLRQMAEKGNAAAENSLGLRYFQGDEKSGIHRDEARALQWFRQAADHGSLAAQSKLGALYWAGRGVPVNYNEAYFWTVLARAGGDRVSQDRALALSQHLTHEQAVAIEQQASLWMQRHQFKTKPNAGR
jgi:putative methionine-R-sulfoxide reductase with GAF domain